MFASTEALVGGYDASGYGVGDEAEDDRQAIFHARLSKPCAMVESETNEAADSVWADRTEIV